MRVSIGIAAVLAAAMALGCGGGTPAPDTPPPGPATGEGEGSGAPPTASGDPALSDGECSQLFRHVLEVKIAEMRQAKPADEIPTDEQVEAIHRTMMTEGLETCRAQPRADFECAMAAESSQALEACAAR